MGRTHSEFETDATGLATRLRPRDDGLLLERAVPSARNGPTDGSRSAAFECAVGPFWAYHRKLTWTLVGPGTGRVSVDETVDYRIAVPFWGWIYKPLTRPVIRGGDLGGRRPWWLVPGRLTSRQSALLAALGAFHVVAGFIYALLGQLLTFIAEDLGNGSTGQQALVLTVSRIGVVVTIAATLLTDRVGRRRVARLSFFAALVLAVLTAGAPSLWVVAGLQLLCRNLSIAGMIAVDTIAIEELPVESRAFAASLGAMAYGLGSGFVVMSLPLTDLGEWAWRLPFIGAALLIPLVALAFHHLPESQRYTDMAARRAHDPGQLLSAEHRVRGARFVALAAVFFLLNLFLAPSSQLQNDYLRTERGFTGVIISVFILTTSTPGGLGVLVGGRWAETRGRRRTAMIGLIGLGVFNLVFFATSGPSMWLGSLLAAMIGGLCVAPLGVLGGELFPTARRGGIQGWLTGIAVVGSVTGLLVAGTLIDAHSYGFAFAILLVAPLGAAALVLGVPETRGLELEDINPGDDDRPAPTSHGSPRSSGHPLP